MSLIESIVDGWRVVTVKVAPTIFRTSVSTPVGTLTYVWDSTDMTGAAEEHVRAVRTVLA